MIVCLLPLSKSSGSMIGCLLPLSKSSASMIGCLLQFFAYVEGCLLLLTKLSPYMIADVQGVIFLAASYGRALFQAMRFQDFLQTMPVHPLGKNTLLIYYQKPNNCYVWLHAFCT
jgi:hypothetical protein